MKDKENTRRVIKLNLLKDNSNENTNIKYEQI